MPFIWATNKQTDRKKCLNILLQHVKLSTLPLETDVMHKHLQILNQISHNLSNSGCSLPCMASTGQRKTMWRRECLWFVWPMNHANVCRRYVANNSQGGVWCAAAHDPLLINHSGGSGTNGTQRANKSQLTDWFFLFCSTKLHK